MALLGHLVDVLWLYLTSCGCLVALLGHGCLVVLLDILWMSCGFTWTSCGCLVALLGHLVDVLWFYLTSCGYT